VIGSAVGGITDQIVEGTGLLLPDPRDLVYFGGQVCRLLADPALRDRLGAGAREHIRRNFVGDLHLRRYAELFSTVIGA
jgi:trehalose synthase